MHELLRARMKSTDVVEPRCPRCGCEYLHHGTITVFDRGEDAKLTAVTTIRDGLSATHLVPSKETHNPSSRRDGITIGFWCEGCCNEPAHELIELAIGQHKGCTEIAWRYVPKDEER